MQRLGRVLVAWFGHGQEADVYDKIGVYEKIDIYEKIDVYKINFDEKNANCN